MFRNGIKLCNIAAHNEGVTELSYMKKLDILASSGVDSLGCCAAAAVGDWKRLLTRDVPQASLEN